jgi:PAS domain S-box-containing protein
MNDQPQAAATVDRRFQMMVEAITDYAIYMLDPGGHITSWNAGASRLKGYRADEVLGRHFSLFFGEQDRAAGRPHALLDSARRTGRCESDGWRIRKDGTTFWALAVMDAIHDDDGRLIGFAKITRDMTERRAAQEALRESERRFRLLVDGVVDYAIYMLDPHGRVTNWNSGAQRIKGYRAHEIVGEHFSRFFTDEDRQAGLPTRALEQAAREGKFASEGWRVRKDGTRFWASAVLDVIRDETGELIGFAKVTRDITEQRQAQHRLDETRAQLFQAQKMEAIGQLTGGIAHDFNNLLTVILGGADMAERIAGDNPKLKRILGNMRHAVKRGENLTRQLLSFSRRQALKPQVIDLRDQLGTVTDMLSRSLRGDIELVTDVPPDLLPAEIDPSELELALLNVGLNARDAMPHGGRLRIAARNVSPRERPAGLDIDLVAVSISDTGIGIPESIRERVIEPFFTTKGAGKGSGLGLSQAYGFASQSGGTMTIDSAEGKGTTVTFYLPMAKSLPAGKVDDARPSRQEGSGRVLVVEDEPRIAELAVSLLEDAGYTARVAANAQLAIDELQRGEVDVVFSDVMLPGGMNGAELAQLVRAQFPRIRILLASGYAEAATNQLAREFPFIPKPYDQSALVGALARVLRTGANSE